MGLLWLCRSGLLRGWLLGGWLLDRWLLDRWLLDRRLLVCWLLLRLHRLNRRGLVLLGNRRCWCGRRNWRRRGW